MSLADLRQKLPDEPYTRAPAEFVKELVYALPYSSIPNVRDAQEVIDFFLEQGWTPPDSA